MLADYFFLNSFRFLKACPLMLPSMNFRKVKSLTSTVFLYSSVLDTEVVSALMECF